MTERFAGRYALLRRLGQGGMGEVFLARDLSTRRECALKRLTAPTAAPEILRREFAVLARLQHPAVVAVHELDFAPDGSPFYTMEYVPGLPADRALEPGDWPGFAFAATEVAHGLEVLHGLGVVHGDLKPSNVLIVKPANAGPLPSAVRLLDFGLAALLGQPAHGHRGTPGYAAPEVVRGEPPSPAADLYGFGALLYAMITGRPPFQGESAQALLRSQQAGPPPALPLAERGASPGLVQLVLRLMAPDPRERPRDAGEVRRELEGLYPAARRPLADRLQAASIVGRERELARLEHWLAMHATRSRVAVVSGPAGAGKTVLLAEMAARAALSGRSVAHLSCSSFAEPGAVALAIARRWAGVAQAEADEAPANLAPDLRSLLARRSATLDESHLDRLVEAVVALGRAATRPDRMPVVLLDDAERLDPLSRAFVIRLALHPKAAPAVWIWARRSGEGIDADEGERVLLEAGAAHRLALGPLEEPEVERLVAARLHQTPPAALLAFLWKRAAGHPGLTVALLQTAAAAGAVRESDAGLIVDAATLETLELPASFEAALLARLKALPEPSRAVAAALAIWGHGLEPRAALELASAGRAELLPPATLETLVSSGLAARDAEGRVGLAPPALAERLVEGLPFEIRRALHRAALAVPGLSETSRFHHLSGAGDVAAALDAAERALAEHPDPGFAAQAAALAESEAPQRAAAWRERHARLLSAAGRYADAIPSFERALALEPRGETRHTLRVALSTACLRAGDAVRLAQVTAEALADDPPPALRSRILSNEAAGHLALGALDRSQAIAREALDLAETAADPEAIGVASVTLGAVLGRLGQLNAAATLARRSYQAHEQCGQTTGSIRALVLRGWVAHARQDLADADGAYREALTLARENGLRLALEEVLVNRAVLLGEIGRWKEVREIQAEAARLALEDGRPGGAAVALANLALLEGLTGGSRSALRRARGALRLARKYLPNNRPTALRALAQAYRYTGWPAKAERGARRALSLAIEIPSDADTEWSRIELMRCWMALERWEEVNELAEPALDPPPRIGSIGLIVLASLAGRAALRNGHLALAEERLALCNRWLSGRAAPFAAAQTEMLRAELAMARGSAVDGIQHAEQALKTLASLPAPAERAAAAVEFVRVALGRPIDSELPFGDWLDQAASTFERLGDRRGHAEALRLQVQWLRRTTSGARRTVRDRDLIEAVSRLLNSMSDLRKLTQRAMELAGEQLNAERGVLLLADPETGNLEPMADYGAVDATTRHDAVGYSRRVVQRVAESGDSLLIGDAPSDPKALSESVLGLGLRSIVCVPMFVNGRVVGAVYLDDSRRSATFSDEDRALLEGFAQLMALAIEKSRGHIEVMRANEELVGENLALRQEATARFQPRAVIGPSLAMQRVMAVVERAANSYATVLITGENGTGKELIARILHYHGKRAAMPFVSVNCGAIPEQLLESELFGILSYVATGVHAREGRFVQANGGTLFLDEIGEMPLRQQVALLAVLANREVQPVGGGPPIPVDVRIIAATNQDLRLQVEQGAFRRDLYYRLNVVPIEVPPLRERKADIPTLARHFLAEFARQQEREVPGLSPNFLAVLMQSDWSGNVRELQNYVERVLAMTPGDLLEPIPLPRDLEDRAGSFRVRSGHTLGEMVEALERRIILETLERAGGNQSLAARELGMTEQSMRYRIRKYDLGYPRQNQRFRLNRRNRPN
ncbi:MAG TPA: sigma 54-interacting transcriptional regulator [Candidatus Limnocylindria bacterium]|nr:sigma 54-interacting transcriptional regulator [Candidatus Limnocylindria bacterium]